MRRVSLTTQQMRQAKSDRAKKALLEATAEAEVPAPTPTPVEVPVLKKAKQSKVKKTKVKKNAGTKKGI